MILFVIRKDQVNCLYWLLIIQLYVEARSLSSRRTNRCAAVRDKHGSLISDPEAQSHRWAEYFEDLLKPETAETDFSLLDQEEQVLSFEYLSEEDESPSLFEIEEAVKKLKNYKVLE